MTAQIALWASVVIGAVAQIVLKLAVTGPSRKSSARSIIWWFALLRSGWIWLYVLSFTVATGLWLVALSRMNVSYAFPLLSASYIFVALIAHFFLKESVQSRRWLGIIVICLGVIIIARS